MVRKQKEPCTRAGLIQSPIQPELEQWLVQKEQTASNICYKSTLQNREALIMLGKGRKLEKLQPESERKYC